MKARQASFDRGEVADTRDIEAEGDDDGGDDGNPGERGRNGLGQFRHAPDDGHGEGHQTQHQDQGQACHPFAAGHAVA